MRRDALRQRAHEEKIEQVRSQRLALARSPNLWQSSLLNSSDFADLLRHRKIEGFNAESITKLWRAGLIRADLVRSGSTLDVPGIVHAMQGDGIQTYSDLRSVPHLVGGYRGIFRALDESLVDAEPLFHPFRFYVTYHLHRVLRGHVSPIQFFITKERSERLERMDADHLDEWTSTKGFSDRFEFWSFVADIAIVLEPTAFQDVFHTLRARLPETLESIREKLRVRRESIRGFLTLWSREEIQAIREEVCVDAEMIDSNKMTHVLLRLMSPQERMRLKDSLGASMQLLAMAEVIRRAYEDACSCELPEEDELGFGQWMQGARKAIYGSERILDATREVTREFLTSMGLDYGVKARCYVEGDTEIGALASAVGIAGGIEFVNLRGQVVERRGRGVNFIDSLKNDRRSHVFSVVVLDGDRDDHVRALRQSAARDEFFGQFFIQTPDFEFANFSKGELIEVIRSGVAPEHDATGNPARIEQIVNEARSGKELFARLSSAGIHQLGKGETWGRLLMEYAAIRQTFPHQDARSGKARPVVEIANLLIRARRVGYLQSFEEYRVDPESGKLVKRK